MHQYRWHRRFWLVLVLVAALLLVAVVMLKAKQEQPYVTAMGGGICIDNVSTGNSIAGCEGDDNNSNNLCNDIGGLGGNGIYWRRRRWSGIGGGGAVV